MTIKKIRGNINVYLYYINSLILKLYILLIIPKKIYNSEYNNSITIETNGTGLQTILNKFYFEQHNGKLAQIIINGIYQDYISYQYNLTNNSNIIIMNWNETLTTCFHMFWGCEDITMINLSNFDSSQVTDMTAMLYACYSLISVDLSNLNISKVQNMRSMFNYCRKLTSLNFNCLITNNLVNDVSYMFFHCISLILILLRQLIWLKWKKCLIIVPH